jgi:hypothetical protein
MVLVPVSADDGRKRRTRPAFAEKNVLALLCNHNSAKSVTNLSRTGRMRLLDAMPLFVAGYANARDLTVLP